tara:strand:- start:1672 stop:2046 length:375 start_codon:yes stop_codon:yes gene_type:complete
MAKEYGYYIDREQIAFVEKTSETIDTHTSQWRTITESNLKVRIYGSKVPSNLTVDNVAAELTLPHFVDEACVNAVIAAGYEDPRNLVPDLARYFEQKAGGFLKEARKKFKRRRQRGGYVKPYDF